MEEYVVHKKVLCVALEDIADDEGSIMANGIIAEDVVSQDLAVLLPAGITLQILKETYPRILIQLSKNGVTHLKLRNFISEKKPLDNLPAGA